VAAIDDPQGVEARVIFVRCPLLPLTRRRFRLARGPQAALPKRLERPAIFASIEKSLSFSPLSSI
jgi:hypothetical protein